MEEMTRLETINRQIRLQKETIERVSAHANQAIAKIKGEINLLTLEKSEIEKVDITKGI